MRAQSSASGSDKQLAMQQPVGSKNTQHKTTHFKQKQGERRTVVDVEADLGRAGALERRVRERLLCDREQRNGQ